MSSSPADFHINRMACSKIIHINYISCTVDNDVNDFCLRTSFSSCEGSVKKPSRTDCTTPGSIIPGTRVVGGGFRTGSPQTPLHTCPPPFDACRFLLEESKGKPRNAATLLNSASSLQRGHELPGRRRLFSIIHVATAEAASSSEACSPVSYSPFVGQMMQ